LSLLNFSEGASAVETGLVEILFAEIFRQWNRIGDFGIYRRMDSVRILFLPRFAENLFRIRLSRDFALVDNQ
jgi:hypothetical protein